MNKRFIMQNMMLALMLVLLAFRLQAAETKAFPSHWGTTPAIQTRDYVELPGGYGHGSSTLAKWIAGNLTKDQSATTPAPAAPNRQLFAQDFEKAEVGKVPDELMVLGGDFAVKLEGTNQLLELPGAPLDSFAVQFGPAEKDDVAVSARILSTVKGRRAATFGVGLGGVGGWKLQVAPAKKALELLNDQEVKASVPFDWKSGAWTQLRLQIRKVKDGAWKIEGKAWPHGEAEPKDWLISNDDTEEPVTGKASILGSPFAGTPIWYDDLAVEKAVGK